MYILNYMKDFKPYFILGVIQCRLCTRYAINYWIHSTALCCIYLVKVLKVGQVHKTSVCWYGFVITKHIYFHHVLIYSLIQYCLNKWKSSCFAKGDTAFHSLSILDKIGNYVTRSINIENQLYLKWSLRKIPLTLKIKAKQQCPQAIPNFLTEMSFLRSPFSEWGKT